MKKQIETSYRPDIDGLRTISVIAVFLFHLFPDVFPSGFLGVDFFFVISGYLITKIILRELIEHQAKFSFLNFYERRCRRILPLLFLVLFVTNIFAFLSLAATDYLSFLESSQYAYLQISNFLFLRSTEYFSESNLELLLHTWSLAVEEQFYLFWPLILYVCYRFRRRIKPIIVVSIIFLFSLLASQWATSNAPQEAFYMFLFRAFEFCVGAFLSFGYQKPFKNQLHNEIAASLGTGFIVLSLSGIFTNSEYPGFRALLPCVGVALLIFTGEKSHRFSLVNRFLANPVFVKIGLLSYAIYLWHWPVIELYKYIFDKTELTLLSAFWIFIISVILSVVSHEYFEKPMRYKKDYAAFFPFLPKKVLGRESNQRVILVSVLVALLFVGINSSLKALGSSDIRMAKIDIEGEKRLEINESNSCHSIDEIEPNYFACDTGDL